MKNTWQGINELLNNHNKYERTITTLKDPNNNGQVTTDRHVYQIFFMNISQVLVPTSK